MTERKMIRVTIGSLMEHQLSVSFPDGLTSKIQAEIDGKESLGKDEMETIKFSNITLSMDAGEDWGDIYAHLYIWGDRLETAKEMKKRLEKEAKQERREAREKKKAEKEELANYKRLKKKFES
jgi:hypothetical protein